jgi:hypothetical protein
MAVNTTIDKPDAARRLARAIASDITIYNEAKIDQAIKDDNLFEALEGEIQEGRDLYNTRVVPELHKLNHYDRAIVDVLLRSKGHISSKIW